MRELQTELKVSKIFATTVQKVWIRVDEKMLTLLAIVGPAVHHRLRKYGIFDPPSTRINFPDNVDMFGVRVDEPAPYHQWYSRSLPLLPIVTPRTSSSTGWEYEMARLTEPSSSSGQGSSCPPPSSITGTALCGKRAIVSSEFRKTVQFAENLVTTQVFESSSNERTCFQPIPFMKTYKSANTKALQVFKPPTTQINFPDNVDMFGKKEDGPVPHFLLTPSISTAAEYEITSWVEPSTSSEQGSSCPPSSSITETELGEKRATVRFAADLVTTHVFESSKDERSCFMPSPFMKTYKSAKRESLQEIEKYPEENITKTSVDQFLFLPELDSIAEVIDSEEIHKQSSETTTEEKECAEKVQQESTETTKEEIEPYMEPSSEEPENRDADFLNKGFQKGPDVHATEETSSVTTGNQDAAGVIGYALAPPEVENKEPASDENKYAVACALGQDLTVEVQAGSLDNAEEEKIHGSNTNIADSLLFEGYMFYKEPEPEYRTYKIPTTIEEYFSDKTKGTFRMSLANCLCDVKPKRKKKGEKKACTVRFAENLVTTHVFDSSCDFRSYYKPKRFFRRYRPAKKRSLQEINTMPEWIITKTSIDQYLSLPQLDSIHESVESKEIQQQSSETTKEKTEPDMGHSSKEPENRDADHLNPSFQNDPDVHAAEETSSVTTGNQDAAGAIGYALAPPEVENKEPASKEDKYAVACALGQDLTLDAKLQQTSPDNAKEVKIHGSNTNIADSLLFEGYMFYKEPEPQNRTYKIATTIEEYFSDKTKGTFRMSLANCQCDVKPKRNKMIECKEIQQQSSETSKEKIEPDMGHSSKEPENRDADHLNPSFQKYPNVHAAEETSTVTTGNQDAGGVIGYAFADAELEKKESASEEDKYAVACALGQDLTVDAELQPIIVDNVEEEKIRGSNRNIADSLLFEGYMFYKEPEPEYRTYKIPTTIAEYFSHNKEFKDSLTNCHVLPKWDVKNLPGTSNQNTSNNALAVFISNPALPQVSKSEVEIQESVTSYSSLSNIDPKAPLSTAVYTKPVALCLASMKESKPILNNCGHSYNHTNKFVPHYEYPAEWQKWVQKRRLPRTVDEYFSMARNR